MGSISVADHRHQSAGGVVVLSSSIALLQERFRQLQKMKELRKEKELLKMFSESDQRSPSSSPPPPPHVSWHNHCSAFGVGAVPAELGFLLPPKTQQHCQLSLSLWSAENRRAGSLETMMTKGPPLNLACRSSSACSVDDPPIKLGSSDGCDVDTSLRL